MNAIAKREVDDAIAAPKRNGRFGTLLREGRQAAASAARKNEDEGVPEV